MSSDVSSSFEEFMVKRVLPRHLEKPDRPRLDGRETGGNREVFGRFRYGGDTWKVHADTHFEPLLLAYYATLSQPSTQVFARAKTDRGVRLDLAPDLERFRRAPHRHLYIYHI